MPRKTSHTGQARNEAHKALQRRLRHIVRQVDLVDVVLGAVLGQLLDALWGDGVPLDIMWWLVSLLGLDL